MGHILVHTALEDGLKGSKQTHEAVSVDTSHVNVGLGDDVGGSRFTLEEGTLSKVLTRLVFHDLLGCGAGLHRLGGERLSADDDKEIVALVPLLNDLRTSFEGSLFNGISNLAPLVVVHAMKDRHAGQEIFVAIALVLRSILDNVVESVTVELPQRHVRLGHDRRRTGSIVQKSQLTKGITWLISFQESLLG